MSHGARLISGNKRIAWDELVFATSLVDCYDLAEEGLEGKGNTFVDLFLCYE